MNHPTITVNPTGEENPDHAYQKAQVMHEHKAMLLDWQRERAENQADIRKSRRKTPG